MGILFDIIKEHAETGKSIDQIDKEMNALAKKRSKEKGKMWGHCESCNMLTCLQADVGLCGPCCWGESSTAYGNW